MHMMDANDPVYRELIKVDLQVMLHSPFLDLNFYSFPKFLDAIKPLGFDVNLVNAREISAATANIPVEPGFGALVATLTDAPISIRLQQDLFRFSWDLAVGNKYPGFSELLPIFVGVLDQISKNLGFTIPYRAVNIAYKSFLPQNDHGWIAAVVKPDWRPKILENAADVHQLLVRWRGSDSLDRSFGIDKVEVSRVDDEGNVAPSPGVLLSMVSGELIKDIPNIDWSKAFGRVHDDATKFLHDCILPEVVEKWTC